MRQRKGIFLGLLVLSLILVSSSFAFSAEAGWEKLRAAADAIQNKNPADWSDFECAFFFHGYMVVNKLNPEKDYSGYFKNTIDGPKIQAMQQTNSLGTQGKAQPPKNESVEERAFQSAVKEIGKSLVDIVTKSGEPASWGKGPSNVLPPWLKVLKVTLEPSDTSKNDDNIKNFFATEGKSILVKKGDRGLDELIQTLETIKPLTEESSPVKPTVVQSQEMKSTPKDQINGKENKDVGAAYDLAAEELMRKFQNGK